MKYLIFIDMRTLDEAKSVYPHLVFKFIDIDLTSDKRYIYRMCEMLANKEANEREIKSVFSNRCEINELLSSDDVDGRSLMQLIKDNAKGNFRRRWYWYKEAKDDWKRTIIYEDENTTINKPSTFIESRNVGSSIWCFCNNEYKWEQHNFGDEPETIYFVHSLSVKKELEYCAVCVRTNGDKLIIDGLHNYLSRQNGAHSGYLSSIGSKAEAKLVSDKTPSLPSTTTQSTQNNKTDKNESKNINRKNTIRLTESELKQIITESVKNIISELDYRTYANAASASKDKDEKFRGYPSKQSRDLYDYAFVKLSRQVCGEDDFALFLAKYIQLHGVDNKIQKMMQQYTDGQKYIQNNQTKWSKK